MLGVYTNIYPFQLKLDNKRLFEYIWPKLVHYLPAIFDCQCRISSINLDSVGLAWLLHFPPPLNYNDKRGDKHEFSNFGMTNHNL